MGMHMGMGGMGRGFGRMQFSDENLPKPKISKKLLLRILQYFIPYWKHIIIVVIAIAATSVLGLIPPMLVKSIVDSALPRKDMHQLIYLILASFGSTVLLGLISTGQNYLNTWISRYIIYDMKNKMFQHLEHMSVRFFSNVKPGDVLTRMTSDIGGVQNVFNGTFITLLQNVLVLASTAILLISMNWKLAIIGMFVVPLFVAPTRKVGKVRWKIASETQAKTSEMNQIIQETLNISSIVLMKVFNKEKDEYENFRKLNLETTKLQIKEALTGRWFGMVISIFTTMGPMMIYFFGGYLFIKGEITVGAIIAFVALLNRLYGPVTQLSSIHIDLTRSLALFERVFEYFDMEHEIVDRPDAKPISKVAGKIEFENVDFSYNDSQQTLKNISFSIDPGKMLALVGPSGAGKTSITNLVPRLYDISSGSIKLDGIDIRDITLESLRSKIGIVTQDTFLFNTSIKDNLLYAKRDATDEQLAEACKASYIYDFIMSLPQGFDTIVGNRGIKLSGGEKQRISLARAILKNPDIIILDEATSSLDSVSESLIQKAIEPLLKGKTSIVIAHRLSTVMAADKILVIDQGEVIESGRHEELLQLDGLYKSLYNKQFKNDAASVSQ